MSFNNILIASLLILIILINGYIVYSLGNTVEIQTIKKIIISSLILNIISIVIIVASHFRNTNMSLMLLISIIFTFIVFIIATVKIFNLSGNKFKNTFRLSILSNFLFFTTLLVQGLLFYKLNSNISEPLLNIQISETIPHLIPPFDNIIN